MTKTTAAAGANTRLALGGLAVLVTCLCLGVTGGVAWSWLANRAPAVEPAVEYILDASPRMAEASPAGQDDRLTVARAVLAEIVRPADGRVSAGLRVFGTGELPEACKDTRLVVPLAPANQGLIATELAGVQAGQSADAAMAEAMLAAIRDLSGARGPHTLVVVTGGQDSCSPQAGLLIAEEAERAGIELETFVVGYQVSPDEAVAIRGMVDELPGGNFLEAHDKGGLELILKAIQARVDTPETTTVDTIVSTAQALPTPGLNLTAEEAGEIVEDEVINPDLLNHDLIMFPWPEPLDPDDELLPFAAPELGTPPDPIPVPGPSWFFWIDDFPAGKFAHPSRLVLVDIGTGAVSVHEAQWWPVLNGEGLWVNPADYWNPDNWGFSNFDGPPGFSTAPGVPLARPAAAPPARQVVGQALALVVNGWQAGETGADALMVDAAGVRAAFQHAGLATTYLGPASDPNRDADYSPAAFNAWIAGEAGGLAPGDTLLLYLTGHGDGTALAGLSPAALQAALRSVDSGVHVIVILDSSYSGAFIPALSTAADRIITATNADTPALFDEDPATDPNSATDSGSEFTSGFVEDWEGILNTPAELSAAQQRAVNETRPVWDVLAELSFHSAVAKDAGAINQKTFPQMVPEYQPTPTPTHTPTVTQTPTPVPPTPTPTPRPPTPTFTPTQVRPLDVIFTADAETVAIGQCTTLRWQTANVQSVQLNQQGVDATGQLQVCPTVTTVFTLQANHPSGQITRQLTINVATPVPSTPPGIGSVDTAGDEWYDTAGCGPVEMPIFVSITNATSATIFYRVQPVEASPSAWSSRPLSFTSGQVWSRTLTVPDMPLDNGIMQFYITATNGAGTSQSPQYDFVLYHSCKP